jgi:hypothetical protein
LEIPPKARACLAQRRGDAEKGKGKRIGLTQSRNARNGRQRKKRKNIASHRDAEPTEKGERLLGTDLPGRRIAWMQGQCGAFAPLTGFHSILR